MSSSPTIEPVARRSLSDAVFRQLCDRIVADDFAPGAPLPAERALCEAFGVNRGALREALKRLDQARLVAVRHGGATAVRDWREDAGLDLLPELLADAAGAVEPEVVRSVMEMRSALAPEVARQAARRGGPALGPALARCLAELRGADSPRDRQVAALAFWSELVRECGNLAYRLAFNSLRESYARFMDVLTDVMRDEFDDLAGYQAIAAAVAARDGEAARREARALVDRGEARVAAVLAELAP
ncbi:MAG TPA: GntR family transcriptional regulator [Myxococcota bacterium]|nr:GntR family transcriptional regulator [Myxococcota bacterium]